MRHSSWLIVISAVGFPLWVATAIVLDVYGHRPDPTGSWDAIVVAGCRVLPNGSPSTGLVRRTTKAVELWRRGLAPVIVLTGGVGESSLAEAAAAAGVARQLGVPDSALILENKSTSTLENVSFLRKMVPFNQIIVVTDTYHVLRCEWLFGKRFSKVRGVGVTSPIIYRAHGAFREAIAIAYHLIVPSRVL
jgi:uncharacterized SAM-binding protein YcdF (DUF218 family)